MSTATAAPRRTAAQDRALKLFVVLTRAANAVHRRIEERTELDGLTETEFGILEALYHKGPLLLGDVQRKILLSSGGVTYAVDRLAEKGLVERRECTSDRRARFAALTEKGTALMGRLFPQHAEVIEDLMSPLNVREQEVVTELLRKLGTTAEAKD